MQLPQPTRHGRAPLIGLVLGLSVLTGCGVSGMAGTGGGGTPSPNGTATPGPITVTPDKQQYSQSDTIAVTIVNGTSTGIVAADHQSNCTTVSLQWWTSQSWQPQNPCRLMIATRLIPILPGATLAQQLHPQGGTPPGWATGTYRVAFTYYVGTPGNISGSTTTIYSATFTVG
jgi:hypothetical protein